VRIEKGNIGYMRGNIVYRKRGIWQGVFVGFKKKLKNENTVA